MSSQIDMFIRFPDSGVEFRFPVIPSDIDINEGSEWHRISVVGLGEVGQPAYRKPQQISFSSFFPYHYDPTFCQYQNLMHPADAKNLFDVAQGVVGVKRPQIVRFIMIEEYESGIWTTWIDDDFAIDSFQKSHKSQSLVDVYYTLNLRTVKLATLQATGALADNIGTEKPHPNYNRTSNDPTLIDLTEGDTNANVSRQRLSPTNAQLVGGVDLSDVKRYSSGSLNYFVDDTSPIGGTKYSYTDPDGNLWGSDSTDDVMMSTDNDPNALGNYLIPGDYTQDQITLDEYTNNGGTVYIGGGGSGGILLAPE